MAATAGSATQVRDLAMVIRMESGERPSRVASVNTDRSWREAAGWRARADPAMASPSRLAQSQMSSTVRPDRAAACSSAASAIAALSCHQVMSPVVVRGPMMASARMNASAGSRQPDTTSQPNEDGTRPTWYGLNTCTGPCRHRAPAVEANRSARVEVARTAPGQSSITSARYPDLPLRGGEIISQLASIDPNTRLPHCARPSRSAYAVAGTISSRAQKARPGRARPPRCGGGQAAPLGAQLGQRGEPVAGAEPAPGPPPHGAGPVALLGVAGQVEPPEQHGHQDHGHQVPQRAGQAPHGQVKQAQGQAAQAAEQSAGDLHVPSPSRARRPSSSYTYARAVLAGTPASPARALAAAPAASRWP